MKAMLVESHSNRRETISLLLATEYKIATQSVSSFEESITVLLDDEGVDLIICEDNDSITKMFKYLISVQSDVPIIVIKNSDPIMQEAFPDLNFIGFVDSSNLKNGLKEIISKGIESGNIAGGSEDTEYCRVHTDLLLKVVPLEADVYIRLSDEKFIKMFHKGTQFTEDDAKKYLEKKRINYLYVHSSQSSEFLSRLTHLLDENLENESDSLKNVLSMPDSLQQAVYSLSNQLGFSEPVQELAKKSVELVLQQMDDMPNLSALLNELKKSEKDYISNHSMAVGNVACSLATLIKWNSEITYRKLVYAGMLHDIALTNDHLAKVANTPNWREDLSNLGVKERKLVVNHPTNIASLALKFKELPSDVDVIIRQHHERPSGRGYPKGLDETKISPLSAVFILAHDLVDYSLNGGNLENFSEFLEAYHYVRRDVHGTFLDLLQAIDEDVFARKKAS